jgi:hypothetical protein
MSLIAPRMTSGVILGEVANASSMKWATSTSAARSEAIAVYEEDVG